VCRARSNAGGGRRGCGGGVVALVGGEHADDPLVLGVGLVCAPRAAVDVAALAGGQPEAARLILGHARADVTQVYAERDLGLAVRVAGETG
jgi:hypothetical protein